MLTLSEQIDLLWVLISASLVMLMQAGFCCMESGLVRSRNSINVAIKNLFDFCVSCLIFWAFGYAVMFGVSRNGLLGTSGFFYGSEQTSSQQMAFFLFQMMFCGTATTIISGAVAERMRFAGYVATSIVISGMIYPFMGHWVWANGGSSAGWLKDLGFIDFAGSTVVHSTGGWVALAAVLIIGPRAGRFEGDGRPFRGHNLTMATMGVLVLWFGWLGFNGGSSFTLDRSTPLILLKTCLSAATAGIFGLGVSWSLSGRPRVESLMCSVVAGLVAITAGCHAVSPLAAVAIGGVGGSLCVIAITVLERFKIDDVVGAIASHAFAGVWGTLAVGLFGDLERLGSGLTRFNQLWVQCLGVLVCFAWSFGGGFSVLWLLNRFCSLRVTVDEERVGLNISEHGSSTETSDLLREMEIQRRSGDFSNHVTVEPFSEIGHVAVQYNRVLTEVNKRSQELEVATEQAVSANQQLQETVQELQAFNQAAVGRELRMIELKGEVNALSRNLNRPDPYDLSIHAPETPGEDSSQP